VNDEVELTLAGGAKLVAIVTHSSREALGLVAGKEAIALIKASALPIATRAGVRPKRCFTLGETALIANLRVSSTFRHFSAGASPIGRRFHARFPSSAAPRYRSHAHYSPAI
jgi:molybdopterin-binding protein